MALVKLHPDSFIRYYHNFGFLVNQRTKVDHLFNARERAYLYPITREPQDIQAILATLEAAMPGTPRKLIAKRFHKLLSILDAERFIVIGETVAELEHKSAHVYDTPIVLPGRKPVGVFVDSPLYFSQYFAEQPTVFAMQLDLASACNLKCIHCYYPPSQACGILDTALAYDVLDQLPDMGTLSLTFTGGEPFMHPRIADLLWRARKNDLTITLQTNGVLITDEDVAMLKEVNVNTVQVSVYSLVDADHDAITGKPGSLRKTLATIEKLRQAGILIYVGTHIMKPNRHSYHTVLRWGAENGIKVVTDFIMLARTDFSTDNLNCRLSMEETETVIGEMLAYGSEYEKATQKQAIDPQQFANRPICGVGSDTLCMSSEGNFYPCTGFMGYHLGNARERRVADVWANSPELQRLRQVRWGDFPKCLSCDAFQFCSMCLARNYNENHGDISQPVAQNCAASFLNKRCVEQHWQRGA